MCSKRCLKRNICVRCYFSRSRVRNVGKIDDSYIDKMESFFKRVDKGGVLLKEEELKDLEESFNDFYFEYGFVQFKRGLEIGLQLRYIR